MDIERAINLAYETNRKERKHLGLSEIGENCSRYLWFAHNGHPASTIKGQILRLFHLGCVIEDVVIDDLKKAGFKILSQQTRATIIHNGMKLSGSCDAIVQTPDGVNMILEVKTANDNGFKNLQMLGYEAWKPKYAAQIHAYMLGLGVEKALVAVYNKNDSRMYFEELSLNRKAIHAVLDHVQESIASNDVPPFTGCPMQNQSWCKFIDTCLKNT